MCRNLKSLYNYNPPASDEEIFLASQQFVRKISGFSKPSKVNEEVFDESIEEVSQLIRKLISSLVTKAKPRNRDLENEKLRLLNLKRFPPKGK